MSGGARGSLPYWYTIHRVARVYGMNPLDVLELPIFWIEAAEASEDAEKWAELEVAIRRRPM